MGFPLLPNRRAAKSCDYLVRSVSLCIIYSLTFSLSLRCKITLTFLSDSQVCVICGPVSVTCVSVCVWNVFLGGLVQAA